MISRQRMITLRIPLALLLACGAPVSGTYVTTQTTEWSGTCDATDLPGVEDRSAVAVDIGDGEMILSDGGGDYPCVYSDERAVEAFSCLLYNDGQSSFDIVGSWPTNTTFEGTFRKAVTCGAEECMVQDCTSEAGFVAELE